MLKNNIIIIEPIETVRRSLLRVISQHSRQKLSQHPRVHYDLFIGSSNGKTINKLTRKSFESCIVDGYKARIFTTCLRRDK